LGSVKKVKDEWTADVPTVGETLGSPSDARSAVSTTTWLLPSGEKVHKRAVTRASWREHFVPRAS
jgi:hypothetical protein